MRTGAALKPRNNCRAFRSVSAVRRKTSQITEYELALDSNIRAEQIEVLLRNLVSLRHEEEDRFVIPFDDVIVTLNLAILLLDKY